MMPLDFAILGAAAGSFIVFFVLQMIVFRMLHQEAVLKAIMIIFFATSLVHLAGWFFAAGQVGVHSLIEGITFVGLSYFTFGLTAFVYILCIFGPSETSIRIRVVRELFEAPGRSLSHSELANRYNARMILERRLERLTRSGEIVERAGKYKLIKKANFFFLIDSVANTLHGFINNK
jgi:D-alanyl-lipoteichoic acid acyltransferase DltB (MBOAT superfamily)